VKNAKQEQFVKHKGYHHLAFENGLAKCRFSLNISSICSLEDITCHSCRISAQPWEVYSWNKSTASVHTTTRGTTPAPFFLIFWKFKRFLKRYFLSIWHADPTCRYIENMDETLQLARKWVIWYLSDFIRTLWLESRTKAMTADCSQTASPSCPRYAHVIKLPHVYPVLPRNYTHLPLISFWQAAVIATFYAFKGVLAPIRVNDGFQKKELRHKK